MPVHDGIEYELIRRNRKSIGFKIQDGRLIVTAAPWISISEIEKCISEKKRWITSHLSNPKPSTNPSYQQGSDVYFLGNKYRLRYELKREKMIVFNGDEIYMSGSSLNVIRKMWMDHLRETLERVVEGIRESDTRNFFSAVRYEYRTFRSKWGCCYSQKRLICFSIYCAGLPLEGIRYIYYHEHAHLVHADHSKNFYGFLERICPDYKNGMRITKRYTID